MPTNDFPANTWVKFSIGDRDYIGRALHHRRASIVATVDSMGKSVTFSWPYICDNATNVGKINFNEPVAENELG